MQLRLDAQSGELMPALQQLGLRMRAAIPRLLALCALVGASGPQAKADALADFYQGRTVTVVVSSSAGGGYDTLARALARFMGRHMPGILFSSSATCLAPAE